MARRPASARRTIVRRVVAVLGVVLVAYLYYHPLRAYFDTKRELAGQAAEVRALEQSKRRLERELRTQDTPQTLAREARLQLSLVKPGEHLFIVKGIDAWRRAQLPADRRPAR
jgi:cell division protein FtsB